MNFERPLLLTSRILKEVGCREQHIYGQSRTNRYLMQVIPFTSHFFLFLYFIFILVEVSHEKPLHSNNVYSSWTDRQSTVTSGCFSSPFFHLHVECQWESNHNHPHPPGRASKDTHVFLPPKFLVFRNLIHNCLHPQISCQYGDRR